MMPTASMTRLLQENLARYLYAPSPIAEHLSIRSHAGLAEALEDIRLRYEVGPLLGPGRREHYRASRGERLLAKLPGTPGTLLGRCP